MNDLVRGKANKWIRERSKSTNTRPCIGIPHWPDGKYTHTYSIEAECTDSGDLKLKKWDGKDWQVLVVDDKAIPELWEWMQEVWGGR